MYFTITTITSTKQIIILATPDWLKHPEEAACMGLNTDAS
jgi:hypothetical protein